MSQSRAKVLRHFAREADAVRHLPDMERAPVLLAIDERLKGMDVTHAEARRARKVVDRCFKKTLERDEQHKTLQRPPPRANGKQEEVHDG